jgi:hypothetical protein
VAEQHRAAPGRAQLGRVARDFAIQAAQGRCHGPGVVEHQDNTEREQHEVEWPAHRPERLLHRCRLAGDELLLVVDQVVQTGEGERRKVDRKQCKNWHTHRQVAPAALQIMNEVPRPRIEAEQ